MGAFIKIITVNKLIAWGFPAKIGGFGAKKIGIPALRLQYSHLVKNI